MLFSEMFRNHNSEHVHFIPARTIESLDSTSFRMSQMLLHPHVGHTHNPIKEQPVRFIGDGVIVDERSIQHEFSGDSTVMLDAGRRPNSENMQASGGLMRYHSAPSSMLASFVDVNEELFPPASNPLSQGADVQFAGLLTDELSLVGATSKHCDTTASYRTGISHVGNGLNGQKSEQHPNKQSDPNRMVCQQSPFNIVTGNGIAEDVDHVHLSAILEHGPEMNSDNFCSSQISIPCTQHGTYAGYMVVAGPIATENALLPPVTALLPSASIHATTSQARSSFVRHSSLPSGLLSRLATEACAQRENSERLSPCFSRPLDHPPVDCNPDSTIKGNGLNSAASGPMLVHTFTVTQEHGAGAGVSNMKSDDLSRPEGFSSSTKGGLLRQSSSPAGLLSQLSLDGIMEDGDELMVPSSPGNSLEEGSVDRRGGPVFLSSVGCGVSDYAISHSGDMMHGIHNNTAFAARKRVRELDAKVFPGLTLPDCRQIDVLEQAAASLPSQFSWPIATSPESQLTVDKASSDAVLCRARAKRGCATHPRSIAERVRRTKISERMKKLQELVPNMDKQTNTADMLDEAVEYVKFLQRQVQELSENRSKCDGSCKQKAQT